MPALCRITGPVFFRDGSPASETQIEMIAVQAAPDQSLGDAVIGRSITFVTDLNGETDVDIVPGYYEMIIGKRTNRISAKLVVPDQATASIGDLITFTEVPPTALDLQGAPGATGAKGDMGASVGTGDIYRVFDETVERRNMDLLRVLRAEARSKLLLSGRIIYVDTNATGASNGSSWANAFTSLEDALDVVGDGDKILTNAPADNPLPLSEIIFAPDEVIRGVEVSGREGPDGATIIDGRNWAGWTDVGTGIWSLASAVEPTQMAFDLRQDDEAGTVTGVNFAQDHVRNGLRRWQRHRLDLRAWYGFLRKSAVATTNPAEGYWSYISGVIYANPPGSPVKATVDADLVYSVPGHGIFGGGSSSSIMDGWYWHGIDTFFIPGGDAGDNYALRFNVAINTTVDDHVGQLCGYHDVGFTGGVKGNRILRCTTSGIASSVASGSLQPFVFFSTLGDDQADCIGHDLVFMAYPHLDTDGVPIFPSPNPTLSARLGYSHTSGGSVDDILEPVSWSNFLQIDFAKELRERHDVSFIVGGSPVLAANISDVSVDDEYNWPITAVDGICIGEAARLEASIDYIGCVFDRSDRGDPSVDALVLSNAVLGAPFQIRSTRGVLKTGAARDYFGGLQVGSRIKLRGMDIDMQDANLSKCNTGAEITLQGNRIQCRNSRLWLTGTDSGSFNAGVENALIKTAGGNVFDEQIKMVQTRDAFPLTPFHNMTEFLTANDQLQRDVNDARFRVETLEPNAITNGDFATDIDGWTAPAGGWEWSAEEGGSLQYSFGNTERPVYSEPLVFDDGDYVEIGFEIYAAYLIGSFRADIVADDFSEPSPFVRASVGARLFAPGQLVERIRWRSGYSRLRITRNSGGNQRGRFGGIYVRKVTEAPVI